MPSDTGHRTLERLRNYVLGMGRIIPCSASGTNVGSNLITLQPNDAAPSIEGYMFGDCFPFWAPFTSDDPVTATLVPKTGTLATLKVYITNGSAQAGAGDVTDGLFYVAWYVPTLDSNAGGFVLK